MKLSQARLSTFALTSLVFLAGLILNKANTATNPPKSKPSVGVNLAGVSYYSTEDPFKDGFKSSEPWRATLVDPANGGFTKWGTGEDSKIPKDAHGWVTSLKGVHQYNAVATIIFGGQNGAYPKGQDDQYLATYQGQGKIFYSGDATLVSHTVLPNKTSQDILKIKQSNAGIWLAITQIDPRNYIKNIRILPKQYSKNYQNDIFNPDFLRVIKPFSTLRFMDWMHTNNDLTQYTWNNRPQPSNVSWENVPVEVMVALANKTNSNPWFNMPTAATDDYIKKFAQYTKTHLNPNLKVYIEYSNEVWNDSFKQAQYAREQGLAHQLSQDPSYAKLYWYAQRTRKIVDIWKEVYGQQRSKNINGVLCFGGYLPTQPELEYLKTHGGFEGIKALAIAAYFGYYLGDPTVASQVQNWDKDKLFNEITKGEIKKGGALQDEYRQIAQYASLAKKYNLELVAYEGGQHLVGHNGIESNQKITDLFIKFNRDPRMQLIYEQFVSKWRQLGGGLFNHYSDVTPYTKWGSWGALENLNQKSSAKYAVLKSFSH